MLRRSPLVSAFALVALAAHDARANSPCGCADPTQTSISLDGERARSGLHSSLAVELRQRELAGDQAPIVEERVQLGLALQRGDWSLALAVPMAWQQMEAGGTRSGLGDVELRARLPVWRGADHAVFALAGLSLPTSTTFGSTTDRLDAVPLGHGATAPMAGAAYLVTLGSWSLLAAPALRVVLADEPVFLVEGSLFTQWQPSPQLALRLTVEAAGPIGGAAHASDGGVDHPDHKRALRADQLFDHHPTLVAAGPELLFAPDPSLLLAAGVIAPIVQDGGAAEEGLRLRVTGSFSF